MKEFHTAKMELKPSSSSAGPEQSGRSSNAGDNADALSEAPRQVHGPTYKYDEKSKIAIKHLRAHVNANDRFKRVIGQTIAYSRTNDNTRGSKIEAELESVMKNNIGHR